jgi:hypothetical protein
MTDILTSQAHVGWPQVLLVTVVCLAGGVLFKVVGWAVMHASTRAAREARANSVKRHSEWEDEVRRAGERITAEVLALASERDR